MLTTKQQRFVEEYLIDANGAAAAIRAGYSDRYPDRQAHILLKNSEIAAAIDAAKDRRSLEVGVDARWILRSLVEEATADLSDLFNPVTGDLLPVREWPMIWRTGLVQGLEIEVLFDGYGKDREQIGVVKKIKLDSRIRRKELIGKHVQVNAFQENVSHKGLEGLGDRLDRAARRDDLLEGAFKRDAASAPVIEMRASSGDEPQSAEQRTYALPANAASSEQDRREADEPSLPTPIDSEPEAVEPYDPIMPSTAWPQEAGHVITDYDPLANDER